MTGPRKFNSEAFLERLKIFGQRCQRLVSILPKTPYNFENGNQTIRSSASPGANYIEALEALGKKDFIFKLRTCRKEARETAYWLELIFSANPNQLEIQKECNELIREGKEIVKILTSSIITLERKNS